jgi:predicted Zn-dependent protease
LIATAPALVIILAACTVNPATGQRQLTLISESQELSLGRSSDQEIVATMGLYPDEELQRYVSQLGQELAARSERPHLPWTFRVVDDPVVNAFALPGGYIYVTRGILTHFNSEAELAGVLGHEIGHVTGRHAVERLSKAQLAQIGLGVGVLAEPELQRFSGALQTGLGVLFLKFSRDDERQADDLGLRYVLKSRYDPHEMVDVFRMLDRVSAAAEGGGRLPGWLSTHPAPENRVERLSAEIAAIPGGFEDATVGRERFLARLDGVVYGEDPRQGYFQDGTFFHPQLAFSLRFPAGWQTQNQRQAVIAVSPDQDAAVVLSLAQEATAEAAAREFYAQGSVRRGSARRGAGGLSHAFTVDRAPNSDYVGLASFLEHRGNVFRILGYTTEERAGDHDRALATAVDSFREVTDRRILDVQPRRVEVVTLPRAMTLAQFAERYPSTVDLATLAILNEVEGAGSPLAAGSMVKRVVGGELP